MTKLLDSGLRAFAMPCLWLAVAFVGCTYDENRLRDLPGGTGGASDSGNADTPIGVGGEDGATSAIDSGSSEAIDVARIDGGGGGIDGADGATGGTGGDMDAQPTEAGGGDAGDVPITGTGGSGGLGGVGEAGGGGGAGGTGRIDGSGDADVPDVLGSGGALEMDGASGGDGTSTRGAAGGAAGAGGVVGTGGATGTGGAAVTGGASGTGGAVGTGGTTAACQEGATQCSANATGLQTCTGGHWSVAVDCGPRRSCTGPAGTAKCTCNVDSVCTSVGSTCSSTSVLVNCAQDAQACFYQSSATTCANGACTGPAGSASCCTNACTVGATCPSSTTLQTCAVGANGCTAATTTTCTNGAVCTIAAGSASCCTNACTVGTTCPSSTTLQTCAVGANGCTAATTTTCTNGACSGSAGSASCCTNACTAGVTACFSSTSLGSCAVGANGCTAVSATTACSSGLVCERYAPAACLDPTWAEWPMPNGQADVTAGAPNLASYTDNNGDGTVTDNLTGLMWQKAVAPSTYTWEQAKAYCPTLTLASHSDWRLPTRVELVSLVDSGQSNPAINTTYFPSTPSSLFWSSSPLAGSSSDAWYVYFANGSTYGLDVAYAGNVRCVR